jgi:hypothetical protein
MAQHALQITTEAHSRVKIAIDDKMYELANARDLDLTEQCVVMRTLARSDWLAGENTAEATDEQIDLLSKDVERSARMLLLECPEDVYVKLTDDDKVKIVLCFAQSPVAKPASKSSRTSKRSPDSKDSTAVASKSGAK